MLESRWGSFDVFIMREINSSASKNATCSLWFLSIPACFNIAHACYSRVLLYRKESKIPSSKKNTLVNQQRHLPNREVGYKTASFQSQNIPIYSNLRRILPKAHKVSTPSPLNA